MCSVSAQATLIFMIAVAILALLQPKDKSPPATIIIEQFRPPVEKYVIGGRSFRRAKSLTFYVAISELPAGTLICIQSLDSEVEIMRARSNR